VGRDSMQVLGGCETGTYRVRGRFSLPFCEHGIFGWRLVTWWFASCSPLLISTERHMTAKSIDNEGSRVGRQTLENHGFGARLT
jgi:hypothetical protein